MAFASPRLRTAVAALSLLCHVACSAGDNDESGTDTPLTLGDTTAQTTDPSSTGATTTTGEPATSTGEPTPTTSGDTTSGTSTTSVDPTTGDITGDTGSSDDTGPICDPGQPNCVCDGDACVDGYTCEAGLCLPVVMQCDADVESPGESEDTPIELGDITDDDDEFFDETGILSGATDVDWFHYHGADTLGYYAEPTVTLVAGTQRTCQFLVCEDGVALTTVDCPAGTDFAISPKLKPGCCGAASFVIKDFGCPGNDDSVDVWLRVDKAPEDICYDYNVRLHF
jgi:hypothetical protein